MFLMYLYICVLNRLYKFLYKITDVNSLFFCKSNQCLMEKRISDLICSSVYVAIWSSQLSVSISTVWNVSFNVGNLFFSQIIEPSVAKISVKFSLSQKGHAALLFRMLSGFCLPISFEKYSCCVSICIYAPLKYV